MEATPKEFKKKLVFSDLLCYNPKMTVIVAVRPLKRNVHDISYIYIKEEDSYDECTGRKFRKEYGEAYH